MSKKGKLMKKKIKKTINRFHLIGIGGIGMSGIARLLMARGHQVSGSDLRQSEIIDRLQKEGAKIVIGHKNDTVANFSPDVVVYSSAISDYSPGFVELLTAKKLNIKILKRAQMIKELMEDKSGIAISGMHGKTTITSMIGKVLIDAGLDPTVLVGGIMNDIKSNARLGKGKYFIVEACEYDKAFLEFSYDRAVVSNIEKEHLEYFSNLTNIIETFKEFIKRIPQKGLLVACGDNLNVKKVLSVAKSKVLTYGFKKDNDVRISNIKIGEGEVSFNLDWEKLDAVDSRFRLRIPGRHNLLNATAAIILTKDLGISEVIIKKALEKFSGAKRRLEIYGEFDGVLLLDDYAHHPTEIEATLEALREFHKDKKIISVFRPSQYSRNKALLSQFGKAFNLSDEILIPRTYQPAGRDKEEKSVDSKRITSEIFANGKRAYYLPEFSDVLEYLKDNAKNGNIVITMGLGPLYELTKEIEIMLKERSK